MSNEQDDIKALKEALAAGPTPGKWEVDYLDRNGQRVVRAEHIEICTCWHHCVRSIEKEMEANAVLIAAANPDRIQRLIDHIERLTAENDELRGRERVLGYLLRDAYVVIAEIEVDDEDKEEALLELRLRLVKSINAEIAAQPGGEL